MVKRIFISLLLVASMMLPMAAQASALVPVDHVADSVSDVCKGIGAGSSCNSSGGPSINKVIKAVVNILSAVVGLVAVIMIIVAGIKYSSSGGDSNKVASAKGTLLYAIIGLVVAAMAQVIVHFVINSATA